VPKFPKLDETAPSSPVPESSAKPAAVHFDGKGLTQSTDHPSVGTITGRQETGGFLTRPHKFDPATGKMLPVVTEAPPEVKPCVARPVHDPSRSKPSN